MRPIRHIIAGVVAVGLTASALAVAGPDSSRAASPPLPLASLFGGAFSLTDHNGQQRTDKDYRGKYMPELLKEYMTHFGPNFVALTGTNEQLRATTKSFRVHRRKVITDKSTPDDYLVDHSSITFLMGPDGKFRTLFPHDTTGDVMATRMAKYLTRK